MLPRSLTEFDKLGPLGVEERSVQSARLDDQALGVGLVRFRITDERALEAVPVESELLFEASVGLDDGSSSSDVRACCGVGDSKLLHDVRDYD